MTQAVYHKGLYYENVINYNNMHVNAEKDNTVIVFYCIKKLCCNWKKSSKCNFLKKWVKLFSRYLKKIDESKRNKEIV